MKIIVAGYGKVGTTLVRQLSAEGHDVTVIDNDPQVLENSMDRYDVMSVQGNCASMSVLEQAKIRDTDLLIAATSEDEVNLLSCMTAHGMNPRLHTIARIRNPEYREQVYKMRELFALSMAVNPERQAAKEIERLIKYPGFLKRDTFAKGRAEIVEIRVDEGSPLADMPLKSMNNTVKCRVLVCAVLREGKAIAPDGNFALRVGDRVFVTASTETLSTLLKNLGVITRKIDRVILCGGGKIAVYLTELLQKSGIRVQIIEQDYERCTQLAEYLPQASVICGNVRDRELLDSEGIASCDAFVTMTGLDELNILLSCYASSLGVFQVITKIGHNENSNVIGSLSLGSLICPKDLCCNTIVRYVRAMQNQTGAALAVHTIADGQAEALEFLVDDATPYCGVPLKDINLRPNTLVVCISHGMQIEIPNGDSCYLRGDTIIVVSSGDTPLQQLNDIFA